MHHIVQWLYQRILYCCDFSFVQHILQELLTLDNLDASKVYKVVVSFKRTYFYEIAFQTTQSSWANSTNHGDMGTVGISTMNADEQSETRIFTINGQYVGNDIQSLDKGMYIIDGKKVMIK